MKSITKKISLLLILSATLFLSSCLDSGNQSIIRNDEPSYITRGSTGTLYARTQIGLLITFPEIETLTPENIAILSYQITGESERKIVDIIDGNEIVADVAELSKKPVPIFKTTLDLSPNPDITSHKLVRLFDPLYAQNEFFGDLWVFSYNIKITKGETANVRFFKASEEDADKENTDVLIDIVVEKTGTPTEGAAEKIEGEDIAVDMSQLRLMMADKADKEGNIKIKFRYSRSDKDKPVIMSSDSYNRDFIMQIENKNK
ncbi:MAG TPA: hypothetical protein VFC69_06435 [Dysgonamonadaceae bacterium]|nr:hypothetical protein [Dysgonamonadaceae bacterium]